MLLAEAGMLLCCGSAPAAARSNPGQAACFGGPLQEPANGYSSPDCKDIVLSGKTLRDEWVTSQLRGDIDLVHCVLLIPAVGPASSI